ncbi:hypothetical protein DFH11DRAFT_1727859 [Phellopilus nigrolimitatus]|nr:hypothetical protein DFH11DRAFT_1727859 [Phellopilus nigrolimitatus]
MASVQFFNQQEAQDALRTLQASNISFPVPSEGTSGRRERVNVRIEPCQPPKWYQTDSSTTPATAAFSGASLSTRVSGTQSQSAPPPSHARPSSAIEEAPSADRPASTSKRILTASGASCSRIRQESSSETSSSDTGASSSENEDVVPRERVALSRQPRKAAALRRSSTPVEIQDDIVMANSQVNNNGVIDISSGSGRDDDDDGSDTTSSSEDEDNESDSSSERSVDSKHNRRQPRIRAGVGDGEPSRAQSVLVTGKTRQSVRIRIPKVKHGRPRRLLLPPDLASPLMTVTMRGDMQFIDQRARKRLTKLSLPAVDEEAKRVEDACLVGRTAIIGYSRGNSQASMVTYAAESNERAAVIPLSKAPHSGWGISCLAPMSFSAISEDPDDKDVAISFLSGGFDKTVMQWRVTRGIKEDKGEGRNNRHRPYNATVHPLGGPLNSGVSSVVYHASSQRVLSAAGKKLWTIDIEGRVPPRSVEFNNLIHQIHVHRNSPDIVILEVQHLYTQMQVYDVRKNNRGKPEMEFGYMDTAASVGRIRARRRRGDTSVNYFTRGFDDGTVCLWDYRNRGNTTVTATKLDEPVWHTVFAGRKSSNVWAYAGNSVTFLEIDPPKH